MVDLKQKAVLQSLLDQEEWLVELDQKYRQDARFLAADLALFFRSAENAVARWSRQSGDVEALLSDAGTIHYRDIGRDVLDTPRAVTEIIEEGVIRRINMAFRRALSEQGLPEEDLISDGPPPWLRTVREDYDRVISTVRFGWERMRQPDSIFDSPSSCYVDMAAELEAFDIGKIFSAYLEPVFGPWFGQLVYQWGCELDRLTVGLTEGSEKERVRQAKELCLTLRRKRTECFTALKDALPARIPAGPDRWLDSAWRERTGEALF